MSTNSDHPDFQHWTNQETATVDRWLMRPGVDNLIVRLVHEWNMRDLLGVDLADQLRDTVYSKLEKGGHKSAVIRAALNEVNWHQLAEQYALRFTKTDEAELVARRLTEVRRALA